MIIKDEYIMYMRLNIYICIGLCDTRRCIAGDADSEGDIILLCPLEASQLHE